jgi:hypothetical protein
LPASNAKAATANPSLEQDLHRHGTWPAKRFRSSSASRAKHHAGSGPSAQTLGRMNRLPLIPTVRVVLAIAFVASFLNAAEMGWRMFAMERFLELQTNAAPMAAEQLSTVTAPMLRAATNADRLFGVVQSQHVELHQKHDLLLELARTQWSSAYFGLLTSGAAALLVLGAFIALARALPSGLGSRGSNP